MHLRGLPRRGHLWPLHDRCTSTATVAAPTRAGDWNRRCLLHSEEPNRPRGVVSREPGFMVNYRVRSLDRMVTQLRARGIAVDSGIVEEEAGRFTWVVDPEGHRI